MLNLPDRIVGAEFVIDTETTGLDVMADRPLYLAWRMSDRHGVVKWSEHVARWCNNNLPLAKVVVAHNLKYDSHMLIQGGVLPEVINYMPIWCTLVGAQLIDEHRMAYNLDALGIELFKIGKVAGVDPAKIRHSKESDVIEYANRDTLICQKLYEWEKVEIEKQDLRKIASLEMDVLKTLVRMERRGVPVIVDRLDNAIHSMRDAIDIADDELWATVGYRTNPRSQKELAYAFHHLGLPAPDSFDREHLELIDHPVSEKILTYRQLLMAKDTFIEGMKPYVKNGLVHCNINQMKSDEFGTRTGRLSASSPNLQQIPNRVASIAKVIRSMFGASDYRSWCSGDLSQFEYRIFAHFVADENVLSAYRNDPTTDFHGALATITGLPRSSAKRLNLSLVFGAGEGKTAKMMGLPYTSYWEGGKERFEAGDEAKLIFNQYHSRVPKTKPYLKASQAEAEAKGFITTILGRRIRFPDRNKGYKAGGLRFQGSAADLVKRALVNLDAALMGEDTGAELVLSVHDSFDALCPAGAEEQTCATMKEVIEEMPELKLPVLVDIGWGQNYWEASQ